jgi:hypothetical protein
MKLRILLALLITIALLFFARRASMRQQPPIEESTSYNGLVLEHHSSHIIKGDNSNANIPVRVEKGSLPAGSEILFYYRPRVLGEKSGSGAFESMRLQPAPANPRLFTALLTNHGRGTEFEYYIALVDSVGQTLATIPSVRKIGAQQTIWLRFEGKQSIPLLIAHIAGMFGGLFFVVLAFVTSFTDLNKTANNVALGKQVFWATLILFLGTFPIGIWIEHQVYDTYWTGIPLGRDITDSKALFLFLFWLATMILLKGSAFARKPEKNLVRAAGARVAVIVSFLVTLAAYLVPHSSGNF